MAEKQAESVGARVRAARRTRRWTQARLARSAGVTRETIYRLEAGRAAHADTLARIARALDVQRELFMEDDRVRSNLYFHPHRTPLRERRRDLGLTIAECAKAAGVSASALSWFERGVERSSAICIPRDDGLAVRIHNEGLARALGFEDAEALTEFWLERR